MKHNFKVIRRDGDHVLLDSQSRPGDVAHSLEKMDGKWVCTCEWASANPGKECKHVRHLKDQDVIREYAKRHNL